MLKKLKSIFNRNNKSKATTIKFSFKRKLLIKFYKIQELFFDKVNLIKRYVKKILNSIYFHVIIFIFIIYFIHTLNLSLPEQDLKNISLTISGIIGGSIAIIFSFSLFILQNSAKLFSSEYLNRFIDPLLDKIISLILVFFVLLAFLTPFIFSKYAFEILIIIFLVSFYLILYLFKELRKRINPEYTLKKIKKESFDKLNKVNKRYKRRFNITNKIYEYDKNSKNINLDIQYKLDQSLNKDIIENFKQLFEIGLRLLSKNEINSFNLSVKYIHDIYLEHLKLRNRFFVRKPYNFLGTYMFDNEGFTTSVLEYLQSISDRLIQEKRKENIYYLLGIYEDIITTVLDIKYADDAHYNKGNLLADLVLNYYINFLKKIINSNQSDWIYEIIKSLSKISNINTQKTNENFFNEQIYEILNRILQWCVKEKNEAYLKELVNIYFYKINLSWNKNRDAIYWDDLFKELKKGIISLAYTENQFSMSIHNLFHDFNVWKINLIKHILKIEENKEQKENLDNFIQLLARWSNFLLDLARDTGLENKQTGLSIIQSIDNNLNIIYGIKNKDKNINLEKLYNTQFYILSLYFQKTKNVEESFLSNLEQVLDILLREISGNLNDSIFDIQYLTELYVRLIEQHFKKATIDYGYNHPGIIKKLVYLGLILNKHKQIEQEKNIITKINELNKKYLKFNEKYFKLKKTKNVMGSDEFQLCKEVHDLKKDLFVNYSRSIRDTLSIIKKEITVDKFDSFVKKIKYCNDVEYTTEEIF